MEVHPEPAEPGKARKRPRRPDKWKRALEKAKRYSAKGIPIPPACGHANRRFKCAELTMADMKAFHETFYATKNKQDQDAFLLKYCKVKTVTRRRPRSRVQTAPKQRHTKLYVKKKGILKLIPVCQKSFLNILKISEHRIRRVAKCFSETGGTVQEKRGGDRVSKKNLRKKTSVKVFIESFECLESHYCRSSTLRKYLPSTLNIKKMWKLYNAQCEKELTVKECYFRRIFNTLYNLGFGSPRTDICSKCSELLERIKHEKDLNLKSSLMIEKRVHILKSKAFYKLLNEQRDNMVVLSFDCQKNQVMPKVADQAAYYSRQLYIYNFGIVQSVPENILQPTNVFLYTRTENHFKKGANEISSAVFDHLTSLTIPENVNTVRLIADGCGAQNKNSIMIGMCATWLTKYAPPHVTKIEFVFPIPGHSFIPPDRVFGLIENELKTMETILNPEDYENVFKKFGTVKQLTKNYDWKTALQEVIKLPGQWHFQFAPCKRFFLRKTKTGNVVVEGEDTYTGSLGAFKSILKRGKGFRDVNPKVIEVGKVAISEEKRNDVYNLLGKHFGKDWMKMDDLTFYKSVLEREHAENNAQNEEEMCDHPVPDSDLRI